MTPTIHFIEVLLPTFYLLMALAYLQLFRHDSRVSEKLCRIGLPLLGLYHTAYFIHHSIVHGRLVLGTLFEFLSGLALAMLLLYLIVEWRYKVKRTGFVVVGLACFFQFIASAFVGTADAAVRPLLQENGYVVHVLLVLFAYSALSLSFIYALLYALQARALTAKRFGILFHRLPPLDLLERMSVGAVKLGVPLMLASILAGYFWMHSLADRLPPHHAVLLVPLDIKIVSALMNVGIYGLGLIGHYYWGWRGRKMCWFAIIAYLFIVIGTGAVHHFFPSFHNFSPGGTP